VIASLPSIPKGESVALKAIWQHHSHLAPRIALSWRELAPRIAASLTKISFKNLQFLTLFFLMTDCFKTNFLSHGALTNPFFSQQQTYLPRYKDEITMLLWNSSLLFLTHREREREREREFHKVLVFSICSCSLVVVLLHQSCIGIACEKIVAIICTVCSGAWFPTEFLQFLTLLCSCDRLRQDKRTFSWRARRSYLLPKTNIPSEV
jgi:hypothetical protein